MSGYYNIEQSNSHWNSQSYYESDYYGNLQSQNLDFIEDDQVECDAGNAIVQDLPARDSISQVFTPNNAFNSLGDLEEPPLLEELEIYIDRITEKMLAVLNPFRGQSLADDVDFITKGTDLAGPLFFCIILALCLFVSGSKVYFGYIYGLSVISCIMMYCLLALMSTTNTFTFASVSSILGYSLLPIVALSVLGLFMSLHGVLGICITAISVLWSSLSASRFFVAISGDNNQRPLIAYPCALVCGVFALLVVF